MTGADAANLFGARVLPVAVVNDPAVAVPMAAALAEAGLPCVEVTLRTPAALEAIAAIAAEVEIGVGAGTVLAPEQVEETVAAGASFVVSPGFSEPVVAACRAAGVPIFPGVATPSELQAAFAAGLDTVKLFPAEPLGGVAFLRALAAPYAMMRFVPTGGIGVSNCSGYLAEPSVLAVGGSWMVAADLLAASDFETVRERAAEALALAESADAATVTR
jgi:2-dehydro-3-deoxyphosphogluconate aldolase/(4S)-4-hydroxy-2-oxoglutarate aldolase